MLELPWAAWPRDFKRYALGDPLATLEVYLAQADAIDAKRQDPRERLPDLFDGDPADPLTPLVDEDLPGRRRAALPGDVARGLRSTARLCSGSAPSCAARRVGRGAHRGARVARREPVHAPLPRASPKVRARRASPHRARG